MDDIQQLRLTTDNKKKSARRVCVNGRGGGATGKHCLAGVRRGEKGEKRR